MSLHEDDQSDLTVDQRDPFEDPQALEGSRLRTKTPKGVEYEINVFEQKFKSAVSAWRKQYNRALMMISDTPDTDLIKAHRDAVQNSLDDVCYVFQHLQKIKETTVAEEEKFENAEIQHQDLMHKISNPIQEIESQKYEVVSNKSSSSSHSSRSRSSTKSGISKISDLSVRKAALKTKLKYLDIESKFKVELQKIQTIKKLEIAGAEAEAIQEALSDDGIGENVKISLPQANKLDYVAEYIQNNGQVKTEGGTLEPDTLLPEVTVTTAQLPNPVSINTVIAASTSASDQNVTFSLSSSDTSVVLSPFTTTFSPSTIAKTTWVYTGSQPSIPSSNPVSTSANLQTQSNQINTGTAIAVSNNSSHTDQGLVQLAKSLADQMSLNRLPPPEPNIFSGDPIQYPAWKAAFNMLIDGKSLPPGEKIYYLKRYLGASVRQVVENYFLLSTEDSYEKARALLDQRYGDPFVIANAFRGKIDSWPKINARDSQSLLKFADFLKQCLAAMNTFLVSVS